MPGKGDDDKSKAVVNQAVGKASLQAKNAAQYVIATQRACPLEKWVEIVQRAAEDALGDNERARDGARRFLSKIIMPADPASAAKVFNPDHSVDELAVHVKKLDGMRAQVLQLTSELLNLKRLELDNEKAAIEPEYKVDG